MSQTAYIVCGYNNGDYYVTERWDIAVYHDKAAAEAHVEKAKDWHSKNQQPYSTGRHLKNPHDGKASEFSVTCYHTTYEIEEVAFGDSP